MATTKQNKKGLVQLMRIAKDLQTVGFKRKINTEEYKNESYSRTDSGLQTLAFKTDFNIIDVEMKNTLTKGTWHFLVDNIVGSLKMYNVLWYYKNATNNARARTAIKELKDHEVLFPTETTGLYIVNPLRISKGSPAGCLDFTTKAVWANGENTNLDVHKDLKSFANKNKSSLLSELGLD